MARRIMNYAFLALGVVCIAYYLACGFSVRFNQSMLWIWLAAGICLTLRFAIVQISISRGQPLPFPGWLVTTARVLCVMALALFVAVETLVVRSSFCACPDGMDYLIVLGAKTGSVTMQRRIDCAAEYLANNPDTICIVSGGKGRDEDISEAECMKAGLVSRGIAPERILTETASHDTEQNISFSHAYVEKPGAKVALVSSDYHMFRALALAKKTFSGEIYALPSRSSYLSYPHYAVREFFCVIWECVNGNMRL